MLGEGKPGKKRKHPRIRYVAKVHMKTPAGPAAHTGEVSGNISGGGIFIHTPNPPRAGTEVEFVVIAVPAGTGLIDAKGRVVWSREGDDPQAGDPAGMGVEFVWMSETSRRALRSILGPVAPGAP